MGAHLDRHGIDLSYRRARASVRWGHGLVVFLRWKGRRWHVVFDARRQR